MIALLAETKYFIDFATAGLTVRFKRGSMIRPLVSGRYVP